MEEIKHTEKSIQFLLAHKFFGLRKYDCIRNVSWGFFSHCEIDLLAISHSGYLTTVEIKISKADAENDILKKHHDIPDENKKLIKWSYMAMPVEVWLKVDTAKIDSSLGIILIDGEKIYSHKNSTARHTRKLFMEERLQLLRLGNMRSWSNG